MKKAFLLLLSILLCPFCVHAADLLEVYQQAQTCDPVFRQAIANRLATKEGVPIAVSALLPNIQMTANPAVSRYGYAGSNITRVTPFTPNSTISPRNLTTRTYTLTLSATQTIFNFQQFSTVAQQIALSRGADATLNAALQDLMIRVAKAYFAVLQDEENLRYNEANKLANAEQLEQVQQQYNVGLKTLTDVYTAKAAYDTAVSQFIQAETTLAIDRENLRVITGVYYPHLAPLSDNFPLVSPEPHNMEIWVRRAQLQNWSIKSSQAQVESNRQIIREQFAGHLPTINVEGSWSRQYSDNINQYLSFQNRRGPGTINEKSLGLNINVPIFQGGGVIAQTNQAVYNFQASQAALEKTIRDTLNMTRQSYLNVIAGISKITADKQSIKSNKSSLEGMEASYKVGTETLVDVLNQQQKLFQAQTTYAQDRYAFVNNMLLLKQAAGTLSFDDLCAINVWLREDEPISERKPARSFKKGNKKLL